MSGQAWRSGHCSLSPRLRLPPAVAEDGSGLPPLSSVTPPTGSVIAADAPEPDRNVARDDVGVHNDRHRAHDDDATWRTTTVIETTDTAPTTESTATEVDKGRRPTWRRPALTTTTVPTDTSGESSEDDSAWAVLALGVALGTLRDSETPTTTSQAPATTTTPTPDTSPAEKVAAEPTSSEDDTPWGWIALGLGLVLAAAIAGVADLARICGGAAGIGLP